MMAQVDGKNFSSRQLTQTILHLLADGGCFLEREFA
jgi:hypothetical protein